MLCFIEYDLSAFDIAAVVLSAQICITLFVFDTSATLAQNQLIWANGSCFGLQRTAAPNRDNPVWCSHGSNEFNGHCFDAESCIDLIPCARLVMLILLLPIRGGYWSGGYCFRERAWENNARVFMLPFLPYRPPRSCDLVKVHGFCTISCILTEPNIPASIIDIS